MNIIDKQILIDKMEKRLKLLTDRNNRDFSGGVQSDVFAIRELKYWLGVVKRGEVDAQIWED